MKQFSQDAAERTSERLRSSMVLFSNGTQQMELLPPPENLQKRLELRSAEPAVVL
jgi:hypothetical protein